MTERSRRISVFDLNAVQDYRLPPATLYFLFVPAGEALVSSGGAPQQRVGAESGLFLNGGDTVTAGEGAWLFQISGEEDVQRHEGLVPVLSRRTPPMADPVIVRVDRIDQPAGMTTPSHHHRGPGIRRLLTGKLLAEVGDHTDLIIPGQAWFESGQEPVVGTNLSGGTNTFIRMMILPAELEGGKSSFVPTSPADAARPRGVTPQVFGERRI
jgi:hypothetical protein